MRLATLSVLLAVLVSPCFAGAQAGNLTMSGHVIDAQSRRPVSQAVITIVGDRNQSPTTSDSDGSFIVTLTRGVTEGSSVRIRVEKAGYETYEKLIAVSPIIPLEFPLAPVKAVHPVHTAPAPTVKTDSFTTLVPLHGEWKNSPVPIDENSNDVHEEFYGELVRLADRPDKPPEGWPVYRDRNFESLDQQFAFVTRLIQFEVFRSIDLLQRGVSGGIKWAAGVGVTPVEREPIVPPDAAPYSTTALLDGLAGNEFLNPMDEMVWKLNPTQMPAGTNVSFTEHANPEKGEVFTCTVRIERPTYFTIDFEVRAGPGMTDQLPAGFATRAVQGTTTYSVRVTMKYEIEGRADHGFRPEQYAIWANSLFVGLEKKMGFDPDAQPSPAVDAVASGRSEKEEPPTSSTESNHAIDSVQVEAQHHEPKDDVGAVVSHARPGNSEPPAAALADVALRLIYPKDPALMIMNSSDSLARDIKWTLLLWNMDLPDRNDPLPIPVSTFDWIRAHDQGGPENLFDRPGVSELLKPGNRLFGSASIDCAGCARGRTYIVYIAWGEGGWYSEIDKEKSGHLLVPSNMTRDGRQAYFGQLEALSPSNSRVQIGER